MKETKTLKQSRDTGLAMVLICLLVIYFTRNISLIPLAVLLLIVSMTIPKVLWPLARLWFGLSRLLGIVSSTILLSLIFYGIVTPVGIFRRLFGLDSLQLKKWKRENSSVFRIRDHHFQEKDMKFPY